MRQQLAPGDGGAEVIAIPKAEANLEAFAAEWRSAYERGKAHAIIVVAEGARYNAEGLALYFKEHREWLGFYLRVTTLGHVQRGGSPGVCARLLATRLGAAAEHIARSRQRLLIGMLKGEIAATPLTEVAANKKTRDLRLVELASVLAR